MIGENSWLRVVTYKLPDGAADDAMDAVKAQVQEFLQVLRKQPGFGGGYWGEAPEDGTMAGVTHWSSLQAIEAAQGALKGLQSRVDELGTTVLDVQNIQLFPVPAISMWGDEDEADRPRHRFRRRQ